MTTTADFTTLRDHLHAAVARAEAEALARHRAGTCGESEWSCSWCPGGLRAGEA